MASVGVDTGNWALESAALIYTKQTMLSKDYQLFLCKQICHRLML